jgi:hypothetical protein
MPGFLLLQSDTVFCSHLGQVKTVTPNLRVTVSKQPTAQQPKPWTVAGCINNVSGAPVPCVTAQWSTAALRLRSENLPILLQDSQALCAPNGTPVNVVPTPSRVKGT